MHLLYHTVVGILFGAIVGGFLGIYTRRQRDKRKVACVRYMGRAEDHRDDVGY